MRNFEFMNMCMLLDGDSNKVLVLDKPKVQGWEGLTFPGGHMENGESIHDSIIREFYEETGLRIKNPKFKGFIHWIDQRAELNQVGILFIANEYQGDLVENGKEGRVFWMDFEDFKKSPDKAQSMDQCLKILLDENITEAVATWDGEKLSEFIYY